MSTSFDATWIEADDSRRVYVDKNGVRHIPAGLNARCGELQLAVLLRPESRIEFRCNLCWPCRADLKIGEE